MRKLLAMLLALMLALGCASFSQAEDKVTLTAVIVQHSACPDFDDSPMWLKIAEEAGDADLPCVFSAEEAFIRHVAEAPPEHHPVDDVIQRDQPQPKIRWQKNDQPQRKQNIIQFYAFIVFQVIFFRIRVQMHRLLQRRAAPGMR